MKGSRGKGGCSKERAWTEEVLQKVIRRLRELTKTEKELLKYIEEIEILGTLFDIKLGVAEAMIKGQIDITKTSLFQEGKKEGRKEGRKEGERIGFRKGEKSGERRGEIKGLRKAILLAVQLRFGKDKVKTVSRKIEEINNIKKLRKIYVKVLKAQSWREVFSSNSENS